MKKLTFSRILGASLLALISAISTSSLAYLFYENEIRYPSEITIKEEATGRHALNEFQKSLNLGLLDNLTKLNGKSYLANEVNLQNQNKARESFIKTILETVSYEPLETNKKNKYGGDYYSKGKFGKIEKELSTVSQGEKVSVSYIDYDKLKFDEEELLDLMAEKEIKYSDSDFTEKLIDLFSEYIVSKKSELPIKTTEREVDLEKTSTSYRVSLSEDALLDQELFSSDSLHNAFDRFSEIALGEQKVESKKYREWLEGGRKGKEPYKWDKARYIPYRWLGFYSLLEGNEDDIDDYVMPIGDGSFENPAGLNTSIITSIMKKNDKGEEVEHPIKVTLLKVSYGSDAIKDLIALNGKNRGLDPKSSVKYIYTEWRVENLSAEKILFTEKSALSDKEGNISDRTGTMYGLLDTVELDSYEWTILQGWSSSTELSEKYLIWGHDFSKQINPVWFKSLKLSDEKVKIPEDKIQTNDISANKNKTGTEGE